MAAEPFLAALVYATGEGAILGEIAERASDLGLVVAGMIQHDARRPDRRRCDMTLVDLTSGTRIALSQDRGRDARGCRLDHAALETAAGLALAGLDGATLPDLLVLSKFGKREIEGHGFRQVVERAVELGVPVLVGISGEHAEGFRAFAGGFETIVETPEAAEALIAGLVRGKVEAGAA